MGIAAQNREIDMTGARAELTKVMGSGPRRIAEILIDIYMPDRSYDASQKKVLEAAAHHCPVGLSLHSETKERVIIHW